MAKRPRQGRIAYRVIRRHLMTAVDKDLHTIRQRLRRLKAVYTQGTRSRAFRKYPELRQFRSIQVETFVDRKLANLSKDQRAAVVEAVFSQGKNEAARRFRLRVSEVVRLVMDAGRLPELLEQKEVAPPVGFTEENLRSLSPRSMEIATALNALRGKPREEIVRGRRAINKKYGLKPVLFVLKRHGAKLELGFAKLTMREVIPQRKPRNQLPIDERKKIAKQWLPAIKHACAVVVPRNGAQGSAADWVPRMTETVAEELAYVKLGPEHPVKYALIFEIARRQLLTIATKEKWFKRKTLSLDRETTREEPFSAGIAAKEEKPPALAIPDIKKLEKALGLNIMEREALKYRLRGEPFYLIAARMSITMQRVDQLLDQIRKKAKRRGLQL